MAPDPSRYRRIAEVLVRNGLSALAAQLRLRAHAPRAVPRRLAGGGTAAGPRPPGARGSAAVLVRNGLSALAAQIGLRDHAPEVVRRRLADAGTADGPARLRRALEELGPTFVKLGQMLSTRRDLLPIEYTQELEHLRAATGAVPYSQVAEVIERELGRPPRQAYAWLEERPLASASIGQAHRGR